MRGLDFLADELRSLDERGLRRRIRPLDGPQQAVVRVDGRDAINFSSNNYLGLANDPALRAAAHTALDEDGSGAGASRLIAGDLRPHRLLEKRLAQVHETEAALLFNSGYHANVGVLSALAGPEDLIVSDELNHASLIDGCRLSRARVHVYAHRDVADAARALASIPARRRFLVTDTLFSMDGDFAPLGELRDLADRASAALVVDEAHATGVVGPRGRGACERDAVRAEVHVATLGKAFGAFGAYVAGSRQLIDFLVNKSRSFVFTTALPPSIAAAALAAVNLASGPEGDARRAALDASIRSFARGLASLGLLAPGAGVSAIFPIHVGDDRRVMEASERLLESGVYAQGIRPPTVAAGTARLRFALMATHTTAHIDRALAAVAELARAGLIPRRTP